jgi:molybdenum cofactor sulfurtransferase
LTSGQGISLRTGCFCNPGAGEIAQHLSGEEMRALFERGGRLSFDEMRESIRSGYGKSVASIRVSLGIASNFADVFRFVDFVRGFLDRRSAEVGEEECSDCRVRDVT